MQVQMRKGGPTSQLFVTLILGVGIGFSLGYAFFGNQKGTAPEATPSVVPVTSQQAAVPAAPAPPPPAKEAEKPAPDKAPAERPSVEPPAEQPTVEPPAEQPTAQPPAEQKPEEQKPAATPAPAGLNGLPAGPGAHLFVGVDETNFNEASMALLKEIRPAGVLLRGPELPDVAKTKELVARLHQALGEPLSLAGWPLVAVEQEGGGMNKLGIKDAPGADQLGRNPSRGDTARAGKIAGAAAIERGIGLLFAPVIAVQDNYTADPAWAGRLFGKDQQQVAQLGEAFVAGVKETGAVAVPKCFPGIGKARKNAMGSLPVMRYEPASKDDDPLKRLAEMLWPFDAALNTAKGGGPNGGFAEIAEGVLASHVAVPQLDTEAPDRSAALSPLLITRVIREEWGYDGVVLADDVSSGPISKKMAPEQAAVQALVAGCDAVLFLDPSPEKLRAVCAAIAEASEERVLKAAALEKSRKRIEVWRDRLAKINVTLPEPPPLTPPAEAKPAEGTATVAEAKPAEEQAAVVKPEDTKPAEVKPVDPKATEAKAAEVKPGEAKPEESKAAEAKAAEAKVAEAKAAEAKAAEAKAAEAKVAEAKAAEAKAAEAKAAEAKAAEAKAAEAKAAEAKAAEAKAAEAKAAEAKAAEAKAAEAKAAEAKAAEAKAAEVKAAEVKAAEVKPAEGKPEEAKPAEAKPEEQKSAEQKSAEAKAGEAKASETKAEEGKTPAKDTAAERPPNTKRIRYTVKEKDTLYSIAARFKVSEAEVQAWNKRASTDVVRGEKLTIYVPKAQEDEASADAVSKPGEPAAGTPAPTPEAKVPAKASEAKAGAAAALPEGMEYYEIGQGDKLAKIATQRNTTVQKLLELNGLEDADKILLGKKLIVPKLP